MITWNTVPSLLLDIHNAGTLAVPETHPDLALCYEQRLIESRGFMRESHVVHLTPSGDRMLRESPQPPLWMSELAEAIAAAAPGYNVQCEIGR